MCMSLTSTLVSFVLKRMKAPFCMYVKKSCPMEKGLPANSSYPGQAFFSNISLQNMANCLHQKQKVEEEEG